MVQTKAVSYRLYGSYDAGDGRCGDDTENACVRGYLYSKYAHYCAYSQRRDGGEGNFKEAGMNDFVPKPIELKDICSKIRAWLPHELIVKMSAPAQQQLQIPAQMLPVIEGWT